MIRKWCLRLLLGLICLALTLAVTVFIADKVSPLKMVVALPSTVMLDRHGEVLRHFADANGAFRHWVEIDAVSPRYLEALIAYEDRYFYQHFGVNPLSTLRALGQWLVHGKIISGSSTLTMQVARLIDPHKRTFLGKFKQMLRALQLERRYSKSEILTLYLNLAPMGGNIEGVETASWRYFSKHAFELNLAESALLVALPQKPSHYRPDKYPEQAHAARNKVLARLVAFGLADKGEVARINKDPIGYTPQKTAFIAPLVSATLHQQYPEIPVVKTSIDKKLQTQIEGFIKDAAQTWGVHLSGAVLVVNNHNHQVYAYVGSPDLFDKNRFGYIDMVQAIRSPGSTLKPFAYGMALDYGIIHEASLLTDVRRNFAGYAPKNFDHKFRGAVPMYEALQTSLNIPIVQVMTHLTPHRFVKTLRDANVTLLVGEPNLSVILGGVGINLWEQVRLFSSLATAGNIYPLSVEIEHDVMAPDGQIMSDEASWLIRKILSDVRPQGQRQKRSIAWKTGTSYGYRDAWAIGVSSEWTVGVWIGRPDGVPNIGSLANQQATPLLFDLFNFLPQEQALVHKPNTISKTTICWPSGRQHSLVAASDCAASYEINVLSGKIPPTLYDSLGESLHGGWPAALTNSTELLQQTKITTLANHSIIFKSGLKLKLEAKGNPPFTWYVNGVMIADDVLDIDALPLGQSRLSVIDRYQKSDSIIIEVR